MNTFFFCSYLDVAQILVESGAKVDYREPTDELYPRSTLCDEPLRLALKNHHYVSFEYVFINQQHDY